MKLKTSVAAAALALAPAYAAARLIDFETVTSFASVAEYYNGGADGSGSNVGPAWRISFGADALGLANDVLGPYFSNAPSPLGVMNPVGSDATMNVAAGFADEISFSYSSSSPVAAAVQVWSGLDGSGMLLASFDLAGNAQSGCNDTPFCRFDRLSSNFAGIARSVTFGAATGFAGFDDIDVSVLPEPASALLVALGIAGLVATRRRR